MNSPPRFAFVLLVICSALADGREPVRAAEPQPRSLKVVGHRGLLLDAPENTLANIAACLELRIGFEVDVRRTKDGTLVCIHDDTVDRTTDGRGRVSDLTLDELEALDAGSWFSPRFAGQRIPTFDAVLALLARHRKADVLVAVDIKGDDTKIEADIVRLAKKHGVLDRLLMIGRAISLPEVRERLRRADAAAHIACLANTPEEFAAALADERSDWVYVRYVPSAAEAARVHQRGKRVFIAGPTVAGHETKNWQAASAAGVDAVLTDYALELCRLRRK